MENVKVNLSNSRLIFTENERLAESACQSLLERLRCRQKVLGITNKVMAEKLGMKESNYIRVIEGRYKMSILRLFQILYYLDLDLMLYRTDLKRNDYVSSKKNS